MKTPKKADNSTDSGSAASPVLSLLDHLATPIAQAYVAPVIGEEPADNTFTNNVMMADEPQPTPAQEIPGSGYSHQMPSQPIQQQYDEPVNLSPDDLAIIAVNMLDGLQQFGLAMFSKSMMLNQEERELINTLDTDPKTVYPTASREAIAMAKYRKHLETVKQLPFTDGEKQRLTDASIIYARTLNVEVTPLQGIMMALGEVMGTRASKIVMNSI